MTQHLIAPHGGVLVDLYAQPERCAELKQASREWPSWDLTPRQLCDLELLMNGSFSPLQGFLGSKDYTTVCGAGRLANEVPWPIPVVLDITEELAGELELGGYLALRDPEGVLLAAIVVEEIYRPDRRAEARDVYGTIDTDHPGVQYLLERTGPVYVAGRVEGVRPPCHYSYRLLRHSPAEMRARFAQLGWSKVVAFQTRNPMHRGHVELTLRAVKDAEANLLIHPVVGLTRSGDVDHYTRVRCYEAVLERYPLGTAELSLLNLAMRMAGPREAVWHAIIRKNYGCSHFIVGRDHAGPGADRSGKPFYSPYAAQELLQECQTRLGVTMVPFKNMVYAPDRDIYVPDSEVAEGMRTLDISGSELRKRLADGRDIPSWFTYPEVAEELRRSHPPRHRQGFTVFFTGLSGAGKSTLANALLVKLLEIGGRPVTLLDGDIVRNNLSSELGFTKEHRNLNVARIGFVASEITKNGGIALCAPIAPYDAMRREVRTLIQPLGGFILVYVNAPLEVCEMRDRKGLYAKARAGLIPKFTGVSDPYEAPHDADVIAQTAETSPEEVVQTIILHLEREGYIAGRS